MYMYLVCLPYKAGDMLAWWADTRSRRVSCRITTHQLYWNWTGDLSKTSVTSYIETLLKSLNSECHVDMFLHRALSLAVGSYVFPTTTTETTNLFLNVMPAEPSPHQISRRYAVPLLSSLWDCLPFMSFLHCSRSSASDAVHLARTTTEPLHRVLGCIKKIKIVWLSCLGCQFVSLVDTLLLWK